MQGLSNGRSLIIPLNVRKQGCTEGPSAVRKQALCQFMQYQHTVNGVYPYNSMTSFRAELQRRPSSLMSPIGSNSGTDHNHRLRSSLFCSTSGRYCSSSSTTTTTTTTSGRFSIPGAEVRRCHGHARKGPVPCPHATSPSAAESSPGPEPEEADNLDWLSLDPKRMRGEANGRQPPGRADGLHAGAQAAGGGPGSALQQDQGWQADARTPGDSAAGPSSQAHHAHPHSPTLAAGVSAARPAKKARARSPVADWVQAAWGRLQLLDLTQISVPISPAAGHRVRQAASVVAAWPLLRPLVKYRNIATRAAITIAMLAVIRSGLYIALPGVDLAAVPAALPAREGERLVRALYGQASALPASLFDLGISPYINASIFVVMVMAIPDPVLAPIKSLMRLKEARKQGRSGQAFITSVINALALLVAIYLALLKAYQLLPHALFSASFVPHTAVSLVAGSAIIQHCANIITASGIGNGSSLVICMSIMDEYAGALHNMLSRSMAGVVNTSTLATLLVCYAGLALAAVYISRTELRLPTMQYASVAVASQGTPAGRKPDFDDEDLDMDVFAAARQRAELRMASRHTRVDYFPLQINSSGMMSIILAGAFWFVLLPSAAELCGLIGLQQGLLALQSSYWGLLIYGLFVMALEFAPLGGVNPKEVAEYLSAINVGIKGVIPGEPTEKHIQGQLLRCKFWGGLALGLLAVCAQLFDMACLQMLGASLSATSLLIIVGTVMQSSRQVESLLEGPRLNDKLSKEQALIQGLRAI